MPSITDLKAYYSGGAANTDPALSVGGDQGALIPVNFQSISNQNPFPGVFIENASGFPPGSTAEITKAANNVVTFKLNGVGASSGAHTLSIANNTASDIIGPVADGTRLSIRHEGALINNLTLEVTTVNIEATTQNTLFPNISRQQSLLGLIEYRLIYIENTHGADSINLTQLATGVLDSGQSIAISSAGQVTPNDTPLPGHVADPSTVSGYSTISSFNFIVAPGDTVYLWLRRTIAPINITTDNNLQFNIEIRGQY